MEESKDRILMLGDIEQDEVQDLIKNLFSMASNSTEDISIVINTYGGDVYEMFGIYDAIKFVQSTGTKVNTIGIGKIMSSGVLLLAAGSKRSIGNNSTIMYHWGTSNLGRGNLFDHEVELEEVKRIEYLCNNLISENTKLTQKQIDDMLNPKTNVYFTAEQALSFGIVDEILGRSKRKKSK
jgi:ATP-dependent Clp endopeptidase proteolytic subunit ClpP